MVYGTGQKAEQTDKAKASGKTNGIYHVST